MGLATHAGAGRRRDMKITYKMLKSLIEDHGGVRIVGSDEPYGARIEFYTLGSHIVMIWSPTTEDQQ